MNERTPSPATKQVRRDLEVNVEGLTDWAGAVRQVNEKLLQGKSLRLALPGGGRLHVDRVLPFLVLYREPADTDPGTQQLISSEAAFLVASGARAHKRGLKQLLTEVVRGLHQRCEGFVLLEVWAGAQPQLTEEEPVAPPRFRLVSDNTDPGLDVVQSLQTQLSRVRIQGRKAKVEIVAGSEARKFRSRSALGMDRAKDLSCALVGIEISPFYRDPETGSVYPAVLRALRKQLALALRRALFDFIRGYTSFKPADFQSLGRRAMTKSVWDVDQRLAEVGGHFDFVLSLNPINT